jgi:hypothetical protein
MRGAEKVARSRHLVPRRDTEAVTEVLADGRRIAVLDRGRVSAEIHRAVAERKFRRQLDVSGPEEEK